MTRNSRILHSIDVNKGTGLEIGPLTTPVVAQDAGDIYYLDHMSQAELKKKYKDEPVKLEEIVAVDFVLTENNLKKTVKRKKFDYIIASHVIEHIPNMVAWLNDAASILKPNGILSLVIPDKRFTFDLERRISEPADIIGAYLDKTSKFTSASMYDFAVRYADQIDTSHAWEDEYYVNNPPVHRWSRDEAYKMCLRNLKPDTYVDSHCYVFTPSSFIDILKELTALNLLSYELSYFLETQENELEFYVSLKKVDLKTSDQKRRQRKLQSLGTGLRSVNLAKQNDELRKELTSITQSLSWRLTQPLRTINKLRK